MVRTVKCAKHLNIPNSEQDVLYVSRLRGYAAYWLRDIRAVVAMCFWGGQLRSRGAYRMQQAGHLVVLSSDSILSGGVV